MANNVPTLSVAARAANLSESMFKLSELMKLHDVFEQRGALTEKQFVTHFHSILESDSWTPSQISQLFMKIDANSDGSVDWDEFTNFMFVHSQSASEAAAQLARVAFVPLDDYDETATPSGSQRPRDVIVAFFGLSKGNHFVGCTAHGLVTLWSSTFQLQTSFQALISVDRTNAVTSVVHLSASNKLAITSVSTGVVLIDLVLAEKSTQTHLPSTVLAHAAPLCLCSTIDDDTKQDVLYIGDDVGCITKIRFHDHGPWHFCSGDQSCHNKATVVGATITRATRHQDHITKLVFVPELNSLVSASRDGTIQIIDVHREVVKREFDLHRGAVYDVAWCREPKFFASCGVERDVLLWNPFSETLLGRLQGHTCSIRSVIWNSEGLNLISLGLVDGVIRVWDVRQMKCLQVIHDVSHEKSHTKLIYFDEMSKNLLTFSTTMNLWPMRQAAGIAETLQPHDETITHLLFNPSFDQLVSIGTDGHIVLWNALDGSVISHFFMAHTTITAAALDDTGRRLITGSNDGTKVTLWNFSNGSRLATLLKRRPTPVDDVRGKFQNGLGQRGILFPRMNTQPVQARKSISKANEVTAVAVVTSAMPQSNGRGFVQSKYILSVGWDRRVYVWLDNANQDYLLRMPEDLSIGHSDDILSMAFCPPKLVATGGMDGYVMLWGLNSGDLMAKFSCRSSVESLFYPRKLGLLIATTSSASIMFFNARFSLHHATFELSHVVDSEIRVIKSDTDGTLIVAALACGSVCVFGIGDPQLVPMQLHQFHRWKTHDGDIHSMEFIEVTHLLDSFVVTASQTNMKLWTLGGTLVGQYGRDKWLLHDRFVRSLRVPFEPDRVDIQATEGEGHPQSIEMYSKEVARIASRGPPVINDVWSRHDIHGTVIDVLTLTSTSRSKGAIEGLNNQGQLVDLELHLLYDIQDDYATWRREDFLTTLVGHVLQEYPWSVPFKVLRLQFDSAGWHLVDTSGQVHALPAEAECREMKFRPYRSFALHIMNPQRLPPFPSASCDENPHELIKSMGSQTSQDQFFVASKYKDGMHQRKTRPPTLRVARNSPTKLSLECHTLRLPQMPKEPRREEQPLSPRHAIDERKIYTLQEAKCPPSPRKQWDYYLPLVSK
ncbi:hypothetical protein AeNC1_001200 [Aphanomyces euteiches]|nr:hypothetical protein AeNC1_001200 [Aphanomyces euteiches]